MRFAADDVEAEGGIADRSEHGAEGFAPGVAGPAVLAPFELADVVGVNVGLVVSLAGEVAVDSVGDLLAGHPPS